MVGKTYYSRWGKNRVRRFDRFRILSIYDRRRSRAGVSCAASITRCTSGVGACVRGHVHEKRPTRGVSIYIYIYIDTFKCVCVYIWITPHASKLAWTRRTARSQWFTVILTYRWSQPFRLEHWTWRKIQFSLITRTCNITIRCD